MAHTQSHNQPVYRVFMYLSVVAAVLLLLIGSLAFWAHTFISDMVKTELTAQKIYFPAAGSPALDPDVYPSLQQYAGQLVDTPEKAEAYANDYIGQHLTQIADGKVYAEVSAQSQQDPTNQTLQQQKQALFQGETLRAMLLTSGYGFGTMGNVAGIAAYSAFIGSTGLLAAAVLFRRKTR